LQLYLRDKGAKTAIRFHHEKLAGAEERKQMKRRWREVLQQLQSLEGR
jgi:RNase P protein component